MAAKKTSSQLSRAKYNWTDAENDYVQGMEQGSEGASQIVWPGYKEIAEKYDIPLQQVKNRAYKLRWSDKRKAREIKVATDIRRERVKGIADKAVRFDESVYDASTLGVALIRKRLEDLFVLVGSEMDPRSVENLKNKFIATGELKAQDFHGTLYFKEMNELSKALQQFHDTGRKALGIKDDDGPQVVVDIQQTNVTTELMRPDIARVTGFLSVLQRQNVQLPSGIAQTQPDDDDEIVDSEIVYELEPGDDD